MSQNDGARGRREVVRRPAKLERIGPAVAVPGAFTWRWEQPDDHTIELDISVAGSKGSVEGVRLLRNPRRPGITVHDLRRLPLASLMEMALAQAAMVRLGPGRFGPVANERDSAAVAAAAKAASSRRRVTVARLREVAEAYVENDGDVFVLEESLSLSRSQVYRLIAKAREAGLITQDAEER
jgi:hypothetical protein